MQKGWTVLIYPRPSEFCEKCQLEKFCPCECHNSDLINCKHYEVRREEFSGEVKPVVDLDHFRN